MKVKTKNMCVNCYYIDQEFKCWAWHELEIRDNGKSAKAIATGIRVAPQWDCDKFKNK